MFQTLEGSSSGRRLYIWLWYGTYRTITVYTTVPYFLKMNSWVQNM